MNKLYKFIIVIGILCVAGCTNLTSIDAYHSSNIQSIPPSQPIYRVPTSVNMNYPPNYGVISTTLVPQNIQDMVIPYAKMYAIDPLIIYAIIKAESNFNPSVKSHANCYGLMQLGLPTAQDVDPSVSVQDLFDPNNNIRIGTIFMKYCLMKYPNNLGYAVSAYNAGLGSVQRWVKANPNFTINDIPYKETRNYVQAIMNNYLKYSNLI